MGRTVVVFGTQRIGAIWALRNKVDPNTVRLATHGADRLRNLTGTIIVVRVAKDVWEPWSHPCAARVRETEDELKRFKARGGTIVESVLE